MTITHGKLRKQYGDFWADRDHKEVPPIPLVPKDDPTTLFTGSGMQQLVPYLLGEPHPLGKKLYNIQPCFRSQDIEEVGDNRHTTFFEMMGNWSLGTYFKKEQIPWFWEFLTRVLGLNKDKLYVSVFKGSPEIGEDTEAYEAWIKAGVDANHIFKYGPEKNWWSRAGVPENMPAGEPGGPDSEVFYEFTAVPHDPKFGETCHPNCDCGRFLEIGNSVFMQFKKNGDGTFTELPAKNVDFGGGLERILAAANDDPDIFKTDLYAKIVTAVETETGKSYNDPAFRSQIRIIADHLKASVFIIKNGVFPTNKEQGYFLRRLLRRAAVKMHQLTGRLNPKALGTIADEGVLATYDTVHFERAKDRDAIVRVIEEEIDRFGRSIERGLKEIQKVETIDGKKAFDLYQSYGFPLEITEELFREKGQTIDKKQFYAEFQKHKDLSRTASAGKFKGGLADNSAQVLNYHTATHLLHQALYDILGSEIRQEGSNITGERLRFDFYSTKKPAPEEIAKVQDIVNEKIQAALPVEFKIMPKADAEKLGAKSFFREKYPDMVKVYFIGDYSKEFCGGPHVKNTGEIGKISIYKSEKIGSNLYRVYAK
jgi:alanyl-tRNA synthetase